MAGKERGDAFAIGVELLWEHAELLAPGHGGEAFGGHERGAGFPFAGFCKDGDAGLISLRTIKFVSVEELVPLAFAGANEGRGAGKGYDEGPRAGARPVV